MARQELDPQAAVRDVAELESLALVGELPAPSTKKDEKEA